jgi:TRAP-type C4-dicarboxylate transport system permease small subunit
MKQCQHKITTVLIDNSKTSLNFTAFFFYICILNTCYSFCLWADAYTHILHFLSNRHKTSGLNYSQCIITLILILGQILIPLHYVEQRVKKVKGIQNKHIKITQFKHTQKYAWLTTQNTVHLKVLYNSNKFREDLQHSVSFICFTLYR